MKQLILLFALVLTACTGSAQLPARHGEGVYFGLKTTAPSNPEESQIYYNSLDSKYYYYNGLTWEELGAGAGSFILDNDQNITAANPYNTSTIDDNSKVIITAATIVYLDKTAKSAKYNTTILNNTGAAVSVVLLANNYLQADQALTDIPAGGYAYVELISADTWSVAIPGANSTANELTIQYGASYYDKLAVKDTLGFTTGTGLSSAWEPVSNHLTISADPALKGFDNTDGTVTINDTYQSGVIYMDNAAAQTVTLPDNISWPSYTYFTVVQQGAGQVTIDATGTTTINGAAAAVDIKTDTSAKGYPSIQFIYLGAYKWHAIGNIE